MTERTRSSVVLVVGLVMAGACVAQAFGRFTYGVLLPSVRHDLAGSNRAAGLLGTVNVGAYLAGAIVVSGLASRVSLVRLIRVGLCLSTGGLLLASFASHIVVLAIALIAMGFGGAAIWIPSPRVAAAALPPQRRGLAAGLVGMGIGLGIVFAGQLARVLRRGRGDASWQDVYRVEGLIGVVVVAATFAFLRHRESVTGARGGPDPTVPSVGGGFAGFGALRRIHGWLALTAAYAAFGFMYLLVFAFLVTRLEDDSGFSPDRATAMFSAVGVAAVFGGLLLGPLSDKIGRRATMVASFLAFGASAVLILVGRQPWVLLGSIGIGLAFSGLPAVIAAYVVDATDATTYGPAYSAATLSFGIAQMLAPQAGGLIADWRGSFTSVFVLSATISVAGAALSARLPRSGGRRHASGIIVRSLRS